MLTPIFLFILVWNNATLNIQHFLYRPNRIMCWFIFTWNIVCFGSHIECAWILYDQLSYDQLSFFISLVLKRQWIQICSHEHSPQSFWLKVGKLFCFSSFVLAINVVKISESWNHDVTTMKIWPLRLKDVLLTHWNIQTKQTTIKHSVHIVHPLAKYIHQINADPRL